jgi:hypothetical protein
VGAWTLGAGVLSVLGGPIVSEQHTVGGSNYLDLDKAKIVSISVDYIVRHAG